MSLLVMDLGGTRLKAGVADSGRLTRTSVVDVRESGGREHLLGLLASTGRGLLEAGTADGSAVCVPGLVDGGKLVSLPGKLGGLEGTDLGSFLETTFGAPRVAVSNDAVAYAMGEAVSGAGRGCRRAVVVTIGTGVGVTVVEDGRPATGGMFGAGILGGFIPVTANTDGPVDSTGHSDTIEALCAAERIAGEAYDTVPDTYAAYERGEAAAQTNIDRYRERLARALVALAHAHAPERLILGGGPMREGNPITPGLEALVNERLYGTYRVEVRLAELSDDASLIGLAHLLDQGR